MSKQGRVRVENNWGIMLLEVHIRHRRGNDPLREESESFYCIPANQSTPYMDITYETYSTVFDYWWVKFVTLGGMVYETNKSNFYCNITDNDSGDVNIKLDANTKKMYIIFDYSSGCSQGLQKLN